MPPKKTASQPDEAEEIRRLLDFLSAEVAKISHTLKIKNMEKDTKITLLENRVDDLEQYSRMNDLIISGLRTKHRSYARAAAASEGISVDSGDIEACHTLHSKNKTVAPAIIIRFTNRKNKQAIIRQGRKLKGTDVYINENLTKKNADVARKARILRKQNKIQATWTSNCKVFIKLNGTTPESAKVLLVRDVTELDKFEKTWFFC
ncbi:unnamed protein product [Boreogadus saida]